MHLQRADPSYLASLTSTSGHWKLHKLGIEPPGETTGVTNERPAQAFINRGAWRVHCPFCDETQFANPELQTRFMCTSCGNADVDHLWVTVEWPADLEEIEAALLARNNPTVMHWYPHEAPEHLYAENVEKGVHDLRSVPKHRRVLVKFLIEAKAEVNPAHVVAAGTIVHSDSEWFPAFHAAVVKTLGKNVSESDIHRALFITARGR